MYHCSFARGYTAKLEAVAGTEDINLGCSSVSNNLNHILKTSINLTWKQSSTTSTHQIPWPTALHLPEGRILVEGAGNWCLLVSFKVNRRWVAWEIAKLLEKKNDSNCCPCSTTLNILHARLGRPFVPTPCVRRHDKGSKSTNEMRESSENHSGPCQRSEKR